MEQSYLTLQALYSIVEDESHPEHYPCSPRDLIVRHGKSWDEIEPQLQLLATENLVSLQPLDTLRIFITSTGIERAIIALKQRVLV